MLFIVLLQKHPQGNRHFLFSRIDEGKKTPKIIANLEVLLGFWEPEVQPQFGTCSSEANTAQ